MRFLTFDENLKRQIVNVVDYASRNIYSVDHLLDMKNGQMTVPGQMPEHLVMVPIARWVCYYLVDHPQHGRSHYFQIKSDVSGNLPDKPEVEQIVREFGIENTLLDKHITFDRIAAETKIILPIAS